MTMPHTSILPPSHARVYQNTQIRLHGYSSASDEGQRTSRVHQIIKLKPGHRFSIDNDIIDIHAKKIGATGVAIYAVLARHANRQTGECWPTIGRIARTLDLARSTVKVYLRKMEKAGLIAIEERQDPAGDPTSNRYTLLDPDPAAVANRIADRKATIVPEGGRPADDPPGRPGADPKPSSLREEEKRLNQADGANAPREETQQRQPANPCPHPLEELSHFGEVTVCQHCWTLIDVHADTTLRDPAQAEEGQAHATCAA
jgi:DNA-binding MarR family transcriptional regulator